MAPLTPLLLMTLMRGSAAKSLPRGSRKAPLPLIGEGLNCVVPESPAAPVRAGCLMEEVTSPRPPSVLARDSSAVCRRRI
jgi:hypothetical protein